MQGPENVALKIEPKLDVLFKLQETLASFKSYDSSQDQILGPSEETQETRKNTIRLKTVAERVVSKAETVVSGSTIYQQSVVGDYQDFRGDQNEMVSDWSRKSSQNIDGENPRQMGVDIQGGADFDDAIEMDIYTQLAGEGFRHIKEQNFTEAEKFCYEAQQAARKTRSTFHQNAASIQLALVYTKLDKYNEVKDLLAKFLSDPAPSLAWEHGAEGFHLLAQACLETDELKDAVRYCDEAMRAQRKLFGKSSATYIASVNLRIAICEAQGDSVLATGYRNMLEPSKLLTFEPPADSEEATSALFSSESVISLSTAPSTAREESELGKEKLVSQAPNLTEPHQTPTFYEPLQSAERLMNELELGANERVTRSLARMRYRPYFINRRNFNPQAALFEAVAEQNIEIVWVLLAEFPKVRACHIQYMKSFPIIGMDTNAEDSVTPIPSACFGDVLVKACTIDDDAKRIDMVNLLLQCGVDPAVLTSKGLMPIDEVCSRGQYDILDEMLQKGAQPRVKSKTGSPTLTTILQIGNKYPGGDNAASLLLSYSGDTQLTDKRSALAEALRLEWPKTFRHLLELGADVEDLPNPPRPLKSSEYLPILSRAAQKKNGRFAALLLKHGANVNPNPEMQEYESARIITPLLAAIGSGNKNLVEMLLGYGADANVLSLEPVGPQKYGTKTLPLIFAASKGYVDVLDLLLDHGAQPELKDGSDDTALEVAAKYGHVKIVSSLLSFGVKDRKKVTNALRRCVDGGHSDVLEVLLAYGA